MPVCVRNSLETEGTRVCFMLSFPDLLRFCKLEECSKIVLLLKSIKGNPVGRKKFKTGKKFVYFLIFWEALQQPNYCKVQRINPVSVTKRFCVVLKVVVVTEMYMLPS